MCIRDSDCREIDNLKLLIINLESSQASDVRVQNTLRDCLIKFKPDKGRCGIKIPVLAAVRNKIMLPTLNLVNNSVLEIFKEYANY